MRRRLVVPAFVELALAAAAAVTLVPRAARAASAEFQRHPVRAVPAADRLVVVYAGLPVTVRLAHLAFPEDAAALAEARGLVEDAVKGKQVRVAYSPEAGLDAAGRPQVYVTAGTRNVNEELVRRGLARYAPGETRSRFYHAKMALADAAARKTGEGLWASGAGTGRGDAGPGKAAPVAGADTGRARHATRSTRSVLAARAAPGAPEARKAAPASALEPGYVYSELNSSHYHDHRCRWAERMSPQRRIRYGSVGAAERAGKGPCWVCFAEQAKKRAFGGAAGPSKVKVVRGSGPIVGSGSVFHAPNCSSVADAPSAEAKAFRSFGTVKAAKAAGLSPCGTCLRLGGGPVPLPGRGECIGRAPPHRRPCRRAPADESGLCLYCQGKGD